MQFVSMLALAQSENKPSKNSSTKSIEFATKDNYYSWDYTADGTYGTESNPFIIDSEEQLMNLVYNVNYKGKTYKGLHFKLTTDIVINEKVLNENYNGENQDREGLNSLTKWYPIGRYGTIVDDYFGGCFDGDGHTISGLVLDKGYEPSGDTDAMKYVGLFGKIKNATIKNLTLRDCYMKNTYVYHSQATHYGALVGYAAGTCTIENCHIEQSYFETNSNVRLGGLVGYLEGGTITGCTFNANVRDKFGLEHFAPTGDEDENLHFGTIVGEVESGLVENCRSEGSFSCYAIVNPGSYIMDKGGICGLNKGTIKGCTSNMTFNLFKEYTGGQASKMTTSYSTIRVGGIAGINEGTIKECVVKGLFSVGYEYTRISNRTEYPDAYLYIGGIANLAKGGIVEDCANYSNLCVDENFSELSTFAGIGLRTFDGDSDDRAIIRRCISICTHMEGGNINNEEDVTNKFQYAAIAAPEEFLTIEKCYSYNTKANKTLLDAEQSGVTHYPAISDMTGKKPFNSTGVWGTWPADESEYAQCPLPIAVGGELTGLRGTGTIDAPFLIANAAELNKAADMIDDVEGIYDHAYYKLEADILMGNTAMRAIGLRTKPFRGTFDGAGHCISNLITEDGYMFGYLYGTVKNLSLVDCKGSINSSVFAGIVYELGGSDEGNKGLVSNCYVSADAHLYRQYIDWSSESLSAAGICLRQYPYGTIENCYVVGNFIFEARTVDGKEPEGIMTPSVYAELGGLVHMSFGGTIRDCYAVTKHEVLGWEYPIPEHIRTVGLVYYLHSGTTTIDNCRYHNPDTDKVVYYNSNGTDLSTASRVASEAELANFFNAAPWKAGYYRPVLEGTKIYAATTPEGTATFLDAIPTAPKQTNYFLKVNLSPSDFNSNFLQKFQGVAFYSPSQNSDYLLNWPIDPDADWIYQPTEGAQVKGRATLSLQRSKSNKGNGWFMLCLPGEVNLSDLPTGSKTYVVGAVNANAKLVNMAEEKTIPAGVPFILYLPEKVSVTTTNSNGEKITTEQPVEDVTLLMEGQFSTTTQLSSEKSVLMGSGDFKHKTLEDVCAIMDETVENGDTTRTAIFAASAAVKPFTAYVKFIEDVELADYLFLDENDPNVNDLIESNNGRTVRVKMLRKLKSGQWNTLCMPFKPKSRQIRKMFGENTVVNFYKEYTYVDGELTIYFGKFDLTTLDVGDVSVLENYFISGCPYLIKPENVREDGIYDFGKVTISTEINKKFHVKAEPFNYYLGTFAPFDLSTTDERYAYFIQSDRLYYVPQTTKVHVLGFRSYFHFPRSRFDSTAATAEAPKEIVIQYGDGTTTRVTPTILAPSDDAPAVYDLQGRRLASPTGKGIYIIGNQKVIK